MIYLAIYREIGRNTQVIGGVVTEALEGVVRVVEGQAGTGRRVGVAEVRVAGDALGQVVGAGGALRVARDAVGAALVTQARRAVAASAGEQPVAGAAVHAVLADVALRALVRALRNGSDRNELRKAIYNTAEGSGDSKWQFQRSINITRNNSYHER